MEVRSLLDIASNKVAKYIVEGHYNNVDYVICPKASNKIYDFVRNEMFFMHDEKHVERVTKIIHQMLRPSKMDFTRCIYEANMEKEDLEMLKKQFLEALKIGNISELDNYIKKKEAVPVGKKQPKNQSKNQRKTQKGKEYFDIVSLLDENLTPETKQHLQKLDLTKRGFDDYKFAENWPQSISQMLTSLTSLTVCSQKLSQSDFVEICKGFSNLIILEIDSTGIQNLKGISKLQNLQELSLRNLLFENEKSFEEIFQLDKLHTLRMGHVE